MKKQAKPKSLEDWLFSLRKQRVSCVICNSEDAIAWIDQLRQIVNEKGTNAPSLDAQAERISEDVGILITPSQLRKHRRSCDRARNRE